VGFYVRSEEVKWWKWTKMKQKGVLNMLKGLFWMVKRTKQRNFYLRQKDYSQHRRRKVSQGYHISSYCMSLLLVRTKAYSFLSKHNLYKMVQIRENIFNINIINIWRLRLGHSRTTLLWSLHSRKLPFKESLSTWLSIEKFTVLHLNASLWKTLNWCVFQTSIHILNISSSRN